MEGSRQKWGIEDGEGYCVLTVKVIPRSSINKIIGLENGVLKLKVSAPPVEGAANEAVVELLSQWLGKPKTTMELIRGHQSRNKRVRLRGVQSRDVLKAMGKFNI